MRTFTKAEQAFYTNIYEHTIMVKERRRNSHKKNMLHDFAETKKNFVNPCNRSIVVLIKAGFTYQDALKMLGKI